MMEETEKQMLREVHSAVIGNEGLGHEGLVKKVNRHEQWINSANVKLATFMGGIAVIAWLIEIYLKK